MEFDKIVMERYATKLFDGRMLPDNKVDRLLEIIRFAPSSFNIQPWVIRIIKNYELKEKLSPASWNQPQIKSCSHLLVFCANTDIAGNIGKLGRLMMKGAKSDSVNGYIDMMRNFEKSLNDDQRLCWAQRQTYLAIGNAVNGAKYLGFDSCPMEGFDSKEYVRILNLPKNIIPTALVTIGYAMDNPRPKIRFPKEDVFILD